jgi:hypothetical protein
MPGGGFLFMNLYFAEWPDKTVSIIHAENSLDLFFILDEEGDPYSATVWKTKEPCAITTSKMSQGLKIHRSIDCVWARVLMPGQETVNSKSVL